jgi:hypothetical protein
MTETIKCPVCGTANDPTARECTYGSCHTYLKSELECLRSIEQSHNTRRADFKSEMDCLRSIDSSLKTIKRVAVWWSIVSILAALFIWISYWAMR